jgi:RNA polymerase II C-terminal domain phosphatase-like 3/4
VLSDVHARFFAAAEAGGPADVRAHLAAARRAVLAGCVVLFTRIIPLDCPDPEAHPLWRLAVQVRTPAGTCRRSVLLSCDLV